MTSSSTNTTRGQRTPPQRELGAGGSVAPYTATGPAEERPRPNRRLTHSRTVVASTVPQDGSGPGSGTLYTSGARLAAETGTGAAVWGGSITPAPTGSAGPRRN